MTEVELPDGTIAVFPDGMTPEQIKGAIQKKFPVQAAPVQAPTQQAAAPAQAEPSYGDQLLRQLGLTGRYAVEGLAGLPAMVGDAANSAINYGIKGVNSVAGSDIPYLGMPSRAISQGLTDIGIPNPETPIERVISYPSKMLAGTGTTAALGKAAQSAPEALQGLTELTKGLGAQAGGAIGGGTAQGLVAQVTDNPYLQFIAALGGGALGGGLVGKFTGPKEEPIPSTQEVKAAAKEAFNTAKQADAILTPAPLQRIQQQVTQDATDFGYLPQLQPRVAAVLQELDRVSKDNITTQGMMTLRKVAQNAAKSNDPAEQALGSIIVQRIDDTMSSLGPEDVLQGNADEAAAAWAQGRDLWGQFRKSEMVDKALQKADRAAQSSGTGGNTDNALRQKIKAILDSDKLRRGFTKDEIAQMDAIVKGGPLTNAARLLGKFSPTSGYLPAAFGVGATVLGGGGGAVLPMLGLAGKGYADRATRGAIEDLSALIRSGGSYAPPAVNQGVPPSLLGLLPALTQSSGLLGLSPQSQRKLPQQP